MGWGSLAYGEAARPSTLIDHLREQARAAMTLGLSAPGSSLVRGLQGPRDGIIGAANKLVKSECLV
jgi:hypothetical protein